MAKISVVVITKNEEDRIGDCLKSVTGWANEVIVVDDGSADKTVDISKSFGARVLIRKMDIEGRHRNWAYGNAQNEWVLSIDADERVTDELKKEIDEALPSNSNYDAFTIPRKNFIGDYWIRGGGLYPAPQLKLFKKGKFSYEEVEVHPRVFLRGSCGHLKGDIIHYTYRDWADFINKSNKQTTWEAIKWYKLSLNDPKKAGYKMNLTHAIWRVIDRFFRAFIAKKGYRDGFIGLMIAYFGSMYQIVSYAKYRELEAKTERRAR